MSFDDELIALGYTDWPHFVRVEAEFGSDGLWSIRHLAYRLASFPFSDELAEQIRTWQERYDDSSPEYADAFCNSRECLERGRKIAVEVKRQLPRCVVVANSRRVRIDGSVGEYVPWPTERGRDGEKGSALREWFAAFTQSEFPD